MTRIVALALVFPWLVACAPEAPPQYSVEVVVDTVVRESYQYTSKYIGRLRARDDVAIQARVTGYLLSREFQEGALVAAGEVLYTIDPSEYEADMASAQADLAAALALQANAERNYKRAQELLPRGAISPSEVDNLMAKKLDADAQIEAALTLTPPVTRILASPALRCRKLALAMAARDGITCAGLAEEGLTGPTRVFEGAQGVHIEIIGRLVQ